MRQMDIINEKLIVFLANATKNCKANKKQLILSSVSLFMAVIILVATTFCWFCLQEADTTGTFNVDAGNGLRLNYNNDYSSVVEIKEKMAFKPLSSVFGQNLYFPDNNAGKVHPPILHSAEFPCHNNHILLPCR